MERWYMRWYIRDDGFLRNCLCSATSTIPLLNRATRNMTAYREGGDGHNTGRLRHTSTCSIEKGMEKFPKQSGNVVL